MPIIVIAAIGIKVGSPGPVLFRARRIGRDGKPFDMIKLRTMRPSAPGGSPITAPRDRRVFPLGALLRKTKIDESPQLWNILRGDMALVGPRPEDPAIVAEHYGAAEAETLRVRPGLTSPGTLWYYTYGESKLDPDDAMASYLVVMHKKLQLDADYLIDATLLTDLRLIWGTLELISRRVLRLPHRQNYSCLDCEEHGVGVATHETRGRPI